MKINCIAIDDEPLALDIIREYCSKVPFLNLICVFDNAVVKNYSILEQDVVTEQKVVI